jgi:putative ABC transport system permease protein
MAVLDRKLVRDLRRMWIQVLAVALVMACGVATIVLSIGAYRSLEETRSAFYDRYRFATVFAHATRAPLSLKADFAGLDGVAALDLRISRTAILDMEGMREPASATVLSLPASVEGPVNRLYLRAGRWPEAESDEAAVLASFAEAHALVPGSHFAAILNGRKRRLTVTAIVLSPEFVYALGPGDMVPEARRFGVIYLPRDDLEGLFGMQGAFNDLVLRTQRNAQLPEIIDRIDDLLAPYGGTGGIERKDQTSHAFLDNELVQLRAMATVIPPVFLFVSAFLVNMILARLIALEREQIGLMKAVGYGAPAVAWHYAKMTLAIGIAGIVIGGVAGTLMGRGLTGLYGEFFSFPFLVFRQSADLYVVSAAVSGVAALGGGAQAIWSVLRLPPAVAMQPPAPTVYRRVIGGRLSRMMSQLALMALRHLLRWPLRSGLTTLGTSFATALLVTALFSFDSVANMVDNVFFRTERQDATLIFSGERSGATAGEVARLPGVLRVESFRAAPVTLTHGHRQRRLVIATVAPDADLVRVLDRDLNPVVPPPTGLTLSERVASILHLSVGDLVQADFLEYPGRTVALPVVSVVQSYVGLAVFMAPDALDHAIGMGPRRTGARVALDHTRLGDFYAAVKSTPAIGSVALQIEARRKFKETIERNIAIMTSVYVSLAVIITFGVVYNSARIHLSERARDLASLKVLGFTNGEVSTVLLLELAIIVLLAQPLGWALGSGFAWSVVRGFESDLFRIPFVIDRSTFAIASLVVLLIAALSALVVRLRIDRLDLVRVLKTRD